MDNNLLSMLGLAKKAGMLAAGEEPVEAAARAKDARVLLLAADAADNTRRRCERFAEMGNCLWLRTPFTKVELGRAVGRSAVAVAALTDIGFASAIVRRMAQEDPVHYDEAAQRLELKAQRAKQRKDEQRAHEKNLRTGKARPKARQTAEADAPPPPPVQPTPPPRRTGGRPPARGGGARRPGAGRPYGDRPGRPGEQRSYGDRAGRPGDKKPYGDRPSRPGEKRPYGDRPERPGEKKSYGDRPSRPGDKKPYGKRPGQPGDKKPYGSRPGGSRYGGKSPGRPKGKPNPFAHSHPVKKGKGSFRKKEG